ncbi:MAG: hypothetical protein ACYC1L_19050 [Alphaproteobacteria bacterium]
MAKKIQLAARELRRQVGDAVGRNFLKTITEPVTNADSILKKQAGVRHATGLLDELLKLDVGTRVNTADIKSGLKKGDLRKIKIEIITAGRCNRFCRVIDAGIGMSTRELDEKFGTYAAAKAKGEKTRSLFGRGALDVLLYHEKSVIYSVRDGKLSRCKIYWDDEGSGDPMCDVTDIGRATRALLREHGLPMEILHHGTAVHFTLREGTRVPLEDTIISKISSFYMLRLVASDPNTEVEVFRIRADGDHTGILKYDFPLGEVIGKAEDILDLGYLGKLPVSIFVARSDVPLETDPMHLDRRENGLLFVDDNDAVLDLTLLPEYDRNPYLRHIYGFVRINGLRDVLEMKLEDKEAEAVLTPTRDGFDRRHEITKKLFSLVERHVKELYETEEKLQRKGSSKRSGELEQRFSDALKVINQFNAEETDDEGDSEGEDPKRTDPIYFGVKSLRLHVGVPRRVSLFVRNDHVNDGEIVLFESSRADIKVEPDSSVVQVSKKQTHQRIKVVITCDVKGVDGKIIALSLDKSGREIRDELRILGVSEVPIFELPDDIKFTAFRYSGDPNRPRNNATLLVNLDKFTGKPTVNFWLDDIVGDVTLADDAVRTEVKVETAHIIAGYNVARLVISFSGTGWGQNATLRARATCADSTIAEAKCKLKFEREGNDKFNDFIYEDLERPVLGEVAGDKLYVNSGYPLHREIFGRTEEDFHRSLEIDPKAQTRAVSVLVETAVYHTATTKHHAGGKKGLHIDPDDPIGSLRPYLDESKMKLEPRIYKALVKG